MRDNPAGDIERYRRLYEEGLVDDAFILYSDALRRARRFSQALEVCKKGLAQYPESRRTRILLSRIYLDMAHYEEAQREIERVLKQVPHSFRGLLIYLQILLRKKDFDHAKRILSKLRSLDPVNPEVRKLAGELNRYAEMTTFVKQGTSTAQKPAKATGSRETLSLKELLQKQKGIKEFYIVNVRTKTVDGTIPNEVRESVSLYKKISRTFEKIGKRDIKWIAAECDNGIILMYPINTSVLFMVCETDIRVGKIRLLIRNKIQRKHNTKD